MSNSPCIAGIGPGNPDFLCPIAKKHIEAADVLIGGKRNLEVFSYIYNVWESAWPMIAGSGVPCIIGQREVQASIA